MLAIWRSLPRLTIKTIEKFYRPEISGKNRHHNQECKILFKETKFCKWKNSDKSFCSGLLKNKKTAHGVMRMVPPTGVWLAEKSVYEGSNSGLNRSINKDGSIDLFLNINGKRRSWITFIAESGEQTRHGDPDEHFSDPLLRLLLGEQLLDKILGQRGQQ